MEFNSSQSADAIRESIAKNRELGIQENLDKEGRLVRLAETVGKLDGWRRGALTHKMEEFDQFRETFKE